MDLQNLFMASNAESRSISAENPDGSRAGGACAVPEGDDHPARELGQGWKVKPALHLEPGQRVTIMDTEGPGVIRHIWFTTDQQFKRDLLVRSYWDGQDEPSVQAPIGDLFCNAWAGFQNVLALPINVNPMGGMNCYFPMPYRKHARITIENDSPHTAVFFYTINYTLEPVAGEALYFHAAWRRTNPVPYGEVYTLIDGIEGRGHYVGTFMAWQQNSAGWWGEGEIKMYLDGDGAFPTICGTGTEDYFGGAWGFGKEDYSAPCLGFRQVSGESEQPGARMTMYRFHVADPVHFKQSLRATMQALGWRSEVRFLPLQDDIASVVYWYQTLPHAPLAPLPDRNAREAV